MLNIWTFMKPHLKLNPKVFFNYFFFKSSTFNLIINFYLEPNASNPFLLIYTKSRLKCKFMLDIGIYTTYYIQVYIKTS